MATSGSTYDRCPDALARNTAGNSFKMTARFVKERTFRQRLLGCAARSQPYCVDHGERGKAFCAKSITGAALPLLGVRRRQRFASVLTRNGRRDKFGRTPLPWPLLSFAADRRSGREETYYAPAHRQIPVIQPSSHSNCALDAAEACSHPLRPSPRRCRKTALNS
jgi:hypothetical protein